MIDCWSFMSVDGMSWMMWAGGLFWLLVLALLVLAAAALGKYLFSDRHRQQDLG